MPGRVNYDIHFFERDAESFAVLDALIQRYRAKGVVVTARHLEIARGLDDVLAAAQGKPLFLFLDPCGLGIGHSTLVRVLGRTLGGGWPPTECLLNFSMEALRRIGGLLTSPHANQQSVLRLDEVLGGDWWHETMTSDREDRAEAVVDEYTVRLANDATMSVAAVPVMRKPGQKPLYYLVHATKHPLGRFAFADASAKALAEWHAAHQDSIDGDQLSLFGSSDDRPTPQTTSQPQAQADIAQNIVDLLAERGHFSLTHETEAVLGAHHGIVEVKVIRAAIKDLYRRGLTSCNGVGRLDTMVITPAVPEAARPILDRPACAHRPSESFRPTA